MRFGITLKPDPDVGRMVRLARAAERHGWRRGRSSASGGAAAAEETRGA